MFWKFSYLFTFVWLTILISKLTNGITALFWQEMREKYGIPDLRRAARFRYASITPLEVGLKHTNV